MRALAAGLLLASVLLAACAGPDAPGAASADGADGDGRTSRGGERADAEDNRTQHSLGSAAGGPVQAGRYPFSVEVPAGGAVAVTWTLVGFPALTLEDTVAGPGCDWSAWYFLNGEMRGDCSDLPPGTTELAVVLHEPVAEYRVDVAGMVWPQRAGGAGT